MPHRGYLSRQVPFGSPDLANPTHYPDRPNRDGGTEQPPSLSGTDYGRDPGGVNPDRSAGRQSAEDWGRYNRGRERHMWEEAMHGFSSRPGNEYERRHPGRSHRGKGPRGYIRSSERIREDICDRLTGDPHLDAADIDVSVIEGEVTLSGTVASRRQKWWAEDCADAVSGVRHIQNNLRMVTKAGSREAERTGRSS